MSSTHRRSRSHRHQAPDDLPAEASDDELVAWSRDLVNQDTAELPSVGGGDERTSGADWAEADGSEAAGPVGEPEIEPSAGHVAGSAAEGTAEGWDWRPPRPSAWVAGGPSRRRAPLRARQGPAGDRPRPLSAQRGPIRS